jgi:hypothetical protein
MLAYTAATQKLELFPAMVANNTGQVAGPALAPIPEPATWLLIAIGLPAVGGFYYRRCCRT